MTEAAYKTDGITRGEITAMHEDEWKKWIESLQVGHSDLADLSGTLACVVICK